LDGLMKRDPEHGKGKSGADSPGAKSGSKTPRREHVERSIPIGEEALEENVEAIKSWERASLHLRSKAEQMSDWIAATVASGPVMVAHVIWFAAWVVVNIGLVPGIAPFDAFPFPFLTLTVSLEAIFLTLFVLASQNRLSRQADKRSHLDLQIDLLAEREMTAVLQLLWDIAAKLQVETSVKSEQLRDLAKKTDIPHLTARMAELDDPESASKRKQADEQPEQLATVSRGQPAGRGRGTDGEDGG
jgi:uncharacterized membrane protein